MVNGSGRLDARTDLSQSCVKGHRLIPRGHVIFVMKKRYFKAALISFVGAALIALYLFVGNLTGLLLQCPFRLATGLSCPGCGSQRAFWALINGDFRTALTVNLILPPLFVYLALLLVCYLAAGEQSEGASPLRRFLTLRLYPVLSSYKMAWFLSALIVLWTIVRNILGI